VNPPIVNVRMNLMDHKFTGLEFIFFPVRVVIHLKILILVGTAIIMVDAVKYACVLMFIPTVNMWWAHTMNPIILIAAMA
jgi:hypothetical protein